MKLVYFLVDALKKEQKSNTNYNLLQQFINLARVR